MLKTIAKNSVFIISARIIDVVTVFLLTFLIARYLDLDSFGQYGFINTLVTFMFSIGYAGITQITIRDVAQNREQASNYLGANLILRTGLSIILVCIIGIVAVFIRHSTSSILWSIAIMTGSEMVSLWSLSFWDILTAHEKMQYDTISTLLFRFLLLILTGLVILLHGSLWYLFLALGLATLGKAIFLSYICLTKYTKPSFIQKSKDKVSSFILSLEIAKQAFPIAVAFLITQANMKIGVLMLKLFSTPEQIALFFAPLRLFFQLQFLPFAISLALFPVFSRSATNSRLPIADCGIKSEIRNPKSEIARLFINSLRFDLAISVPVAIIFVLFAQPIILLVFGNKFTAAVPCLQILMLSLPLIFLELLLANFFISIQRQTIILVSNSLCFLANILLNLILIPRYGALGTSWATSIAYFILFITFFYFIRQYTGSNAVLVPFLKALLAGIGMGVIMYFLQQFNWFLSLAAGIMVYGFLIYLVKGISTDEIKMLRDLLKKPILSSPIDE